MIAMSHRPVAQRSEPTPYKGQTTVRLRPGLLMEDDNGIKVLAAAHSVLTRASDGSSPSGPTEEMHWSFSGKDSALVMRQRGFESHLVLLDL